MLPKTVGYQTQDGDVLCPTCHHKQHITQACDCYQMKEGELVEDYYDHSRSTCEAKIEGLTGGDDDICTIRFPKAPAKIVAYSTQCGDVVCVDCHCSVHPKGEPCDCQPLYTGDHVRHQDAFCFDCNASLDGLHIDDRLALPSYVPPAQAPATSTAKPYDVVGAIIDYESGDLSQEATITLFQHLIDDGSAWTLQGSYGRMAQALIDAGYCHEARPLAQAQAEALNTPCAQCGKPLGPQVFLGPVCGACCKANHRKATGGRA